MTNGATEEADGDDECTQLPLVDYEATGEIFAVYPQANVVEVWDWDPASDDLCLATRLQFGGKSTAAIECMRVVSDLNLAIARDNILELHTVYIDLDTTDVEATIDVGAHIVNIRRSSGWIVAGDEYGQLHVFDESLNPQDVRYSTSLDKLGVPIFDIQGDWLVYSPMKAEHQRLKGEARLGCSSRYLTPVKMPPRGPLLARVLLLFSKLALDGLVALLRALLKRIKHLVNEGGDYRALLISKLIGNLLYNTALQTALSIQKTADARKPQDNQLIKVIHLGTHATKAAFRPPGGVLAVLLLPYDLQLIQVSHRGDTYYMWDLYRLPLEISLVGKFTRGKTKAIVNDLTWYMTQTELGGVNCGFGLVLEGLGTVHWFNINYFWGQTNNLPVRSNKLGQSQFVDAWLFPLEGARRIITLPRQHKLGILTKLGALKIVTSIDGSHSYQYDLPLTLPENWQDYDRVVFDRTLEKDEVEEKAKVNPSDAIAQAEINTCFAFLNLVNNDNVAFATFDEAAPIWGSTEVTIVKPFGSTPAKPAALESDGVDVLGDVVIDPDLVECLVPTS